MADPAAQNAANPAPAPFEQKLVKFDLEGHFHYTFTVDLELDLTDPTLDKKFKLEGVPLAGEWTCVCRRDGVDMVLEVLHGVLPVAFFGKHVDIVLKVYWRDVYASNFLGLSRFEDGPMPAANPQKPGTGYGGFRIDMSPHILETAATTSSGRFDVKTHRSYRLSMVIHSRGLETTPEAEMLIKRMPELDLIATPHNIRLFFPAHGADLWAESTLLSRSSPYFKMLLPSGFSESNTVCPCATCIFDDSDDETDELYFKKHPPRQDVRDEPQCTHKEIKITETAFTTYRAVLAFLRTGFIAFAPLSSTLLSSSPADAPTRASRIEAVVSTDPTLPYPVSPKSTFRLAHLLELDNLQELCLANLAKQLTVDCAAVELFSTSVRYDDWRKVVLDFVADNCDAVTASSAWAEVTEKVKRDEIRGSGPIMLELFERKVPKTAQSCVAT
ncbi:hypothetical protein NBRC10513v2_004541 [Rhodotorula toruloides]